MAIWHYDLTGAEPILRDVPIYAVAKICDGEMVQAGPTGAELASGFVTTNALTTTAGVDSLGACNETITTTSYADRGDIISTAATISTKAISSIASTVATGSRYGKVIINPYAVYLMEYDQSSTSYFTCAACTASATYTDTVERYNEGSWFYVVPAPSTAANAGQLRYITATSTTASWTFLTAATTTTSDSAINIKAINHRLLGVSGVASTATVDYPTKLTNLTSNDALQTVSYHVVENYVGGKNRPMEYLRAQVHNGLTDTTLKFYSDIVQLDHVYCKTA